jgi:hypothetical protein
MPAVHFRGAHQHGDALRIEVVARVRPHIRLGVLSNIILLFRERQDRLQPVAFKAWPGSRSNRQAE